MQTRGGGGGDTTTGNNIEHRTYIEKCDSSEEDDSNLFKYKCEFLVGKFGPNDFKIKLRQNNLIVEATREIHNKKSPHQFDLDNFYYDNDQTYLNTNDDDNYFDMRETESFGREVSVPNFVDLNSLSCYLETYEDFQNVLVVEGFVNKARYYLDADLVRNARIKTSRQHRQDLDIAEAESSSIHRQYQNHNQNNHQRHQHKRHQQNQQKTTQNSSNFRNRRETMNPIDQLSSDTYLKYKFDLSDFDSNNISITIRDKTILNVSAVRTLFDSATGKHTQDYFDHNINLPENVEIHNIKNCFDENDGLLRIEIPLKPISTTTSSSIREELIGTPKSTSTLRRANNKQQQQLENSSNSRRNSSSNSSKNNTSSSRDSSSSSSSNAGSTTKVIKARSSSSSAAAGIARIHKDNKSVSASNNKLTTDEDKYLELVFDLYDFKFDRIDVRENVEKKKILVVRAFKGTTETNENQNKPYIRKYILPDWVNCENMSVSQEKQTVDGELKNLLIVQISIQE